MWRQEVFVGHWVKLAWNTTPSAEWLCDPETKRDPHSCEYSAISRLDFMSQTLKLEFLFEDPVSDEARRKIAAGLPWQEKNWGFLEEDGRLLVVYSLFPCTVLLEYDPASDGGVRPYRKICYTNQDGNLPALVLQHTGHDISSSRLSGNPVLYEYQGGMQYIAVVHSRKNAIYRNWALRIDARTWQVTHVSAGPVLKSSDYAVRGYFHGVLVISSFHIVEVRQQPVLRLFLGEGDRFSCWEDIALQDIVWYKLETCS